MAIVDYKKSYPPLLNRKKTFCAKCAKPLNVFLIRKNAQTPKIKCLSCSPPRLGDRGLSPEELHSLLSILR